MPFRWSRAVWAMVAVLAALPARADEVVLTNGKTMEADSIEEHGDEYILVTEFMRVQVKRADVARIVRKRPPDPPAATRSEGSASNPVPPERAASVRCTPPVLPAFGDHWPAQDRSDLERMGTETGDERYLRMLAIVDDPDSRRLTEVIGYVELPDPAMHRAAMRALGAFDGKEPVAILLRERRAEDPSRSEAARDGLLRWCARNRANGTPFLHHMVLQLDPVWVAALLELAADVDIDWARPVLYHGMEWGRAQVRTVAWKALRSARDPDLARFLMTGLVDAEWEVRIEAARACVDLKETRALRRLIDLLRDPEPRVVEAAHGALQELTGLEGPPDERAWRGWWRENYGD